jgi:hypothetical protein
MVHIRLVLTACLFETEYETQRNCQNNKSSNKKIEKHGNSNEVESTKRSVVPQPMVEVVDFSVFPL